MLSSPYKIYLQELNFVAKEPNCYNNEIDYCIELRIIVYLFHTLVLFHSRISDYAIKD